MSLTSVEIPCCLCGSMIQPNAANQCGPCLAQTIDWKDKFRGPFYTYQCRVCRRFQNATNSKRYDFMEPESPELLAVCLKTLPLSQFKVVDASWIFTEPHSMRWKVKVTLRKEVESVMVQQRLMVELINKWQMCGDCNRQFTNRTWQAVVQVRQHHRQKKTLASLEMAISKNEKLRKHVLSIDGKNDGFDFYFLSNVHANAFVQHLQGISPMRVKTSQKMVSEDLRNNTANVKTSHTIDIVPLGKHDLIYLPKTVKSKLAGRIVLVHNISSQIRLVDADPPRNTTAVTTDLSADQYYKNEKSIVVLAIPTRMIKFVVLDVELCPVGDSETNTKYSLADVQVVKEHDFEQVFHVVSHLGNILQAGDTVWGYELKQLAHDMDQYLQNVPEIVLVQKFHQTSDVQPDETKPTLSKKKTRRQRKENRRARELEESAERMGFLQDEDPNSLEMDLQALEEALDAVEVNYEA